MRFIRMAVILSSMSILAMAGLEPTGKTSVLDELGLVSKAEARLGRPLTPVSVAGVGRRTVRRCAVGVYNC